MHATAISPQDDLSSLKACIYAECARKVVFQVGHCELNGIEIFAPGASPQQIEHLPTVIVGAAGVGPDKECKCPICLEDLAPGSVLRLLPCTHQFHRDCVDKWLAQKATCPICQRSL